MPQGKGKELQKMRRIGIMGGTFNPIHMGHLLLAEWALEEVGLDEVWFLPTGAPYMKSPREVLPGTERLRMTSLAVSGNPRFRCLDLETRRDGPTYTCETLELLKKDYPLDDFFFIVGGDCLFTIERWKNPEDIFRSCTLVAAARGEVLSEEMEEKKRSLEQRYEGRIILLPFMAFSISSSLIRQRIRKGQSVRYLVCDSVLSYIEEKGFYREESESVEKAPQSDGKGTGCETF